MANPKLNITRYDSVPNPAPPGYVGYVGYVEPEVIDGERYPRWVLYFGMDFADFYAHRDPETGHVIGVPTRSDRPDNEPGTVTICGSLLAGVLTLVLPLAACGPGEAWGEGAGDGDGDSSGYSEGTGDGDGDGDGEPLVPGEELRCVELVPGSVSCWVDWGIAWARVMLPCQVSQGVEAGAWGEGFDNAVEPWGPVVCHGLLGGGRFCLYTEANVLLTEALGWAPEVSALVGQLQVVDPPCGGEGDGCDGEPGELGCPCSLTDLDGDGTVPEGGECYLGLVCLTNPTEYTCLQA